MTVLLEHCHWSKSYGEFRALDQVTMTVHEGELVSVVGPNGAGKTTLVNLLTGLLEPTAGDVLFMGKNIAGVGPVALADHGLARTFQLIQIFPELTVQETIAAAVVSRQKKRWRFWLAFLLMPWDRCACGRGRRYIWARAAARYCRSNVVAGREEAIGRRFRLWA